VDEGALLAEQAVGERGLAGVGAADEGDAERAARAIGLIVAVAAAVAVARADRDRCRDRQALGDDLEQPIDAAAVRRRDRERLAQAHPVELVDQLVALGVVDLVDREHDRLAGRAQPGRDLEVERREPERPVDDEDEEVGLADRALGLAVDAGADHVARRDRIEPAGVDHAQRAAEVVDVAVAAVAGQARRVVDERGPAADEPVEQRRLADVGPADERDRPCHRAPPSRSPP
jgi:hypothetical protein